MERVNYQSSETQLASGDLIMLFTDGLIEVQNANDQLYNQQLLLAAVQSRLQMPAPQLMDEILDEIRKFSAEAVFSDDVCLVGVELT